MVDWDRVEELRSKGWDWEKVADDPKVGFHPDASVHDSGRALRGLYHRQRSRQARRGEERKVKAPTKEDKEKAERRWSLVRIGYLVVPIVGLWFLFAYLIPSPVGLIIPAIPYLALILVVVVFLLLYGLFRTTDKRWSKVFRSTVVTGIALGLVLSGVIALGGVLFGCPILPPAAAGTTQPGPGWVSFNVGSWQENGLPTFYFYGATWCPYCSASSWAIWKALSGFGTWSGTYTQYSTEDSIPEMSLARAVLTSSYVSFVASVDTSNATGTFPATANCVQAAYVTAYSGSAIPFVVINGQYVHGSATGGGTLINPSDVQSYTTGAMAQNVSTETGQPWSVVQDQTWWMMAFLAKSCGATSDNLSSQGYYAKWSSATRTNVASDLAQIK